MEIYKPCFYHTIYSIALVRTYVQKEHHVDIYNNNNNNLVWLCVFSGREENKKLFSLFDDEMVNFGNIWK